MVTVRLSPTFAYHHTTLTARDDGIGGMLRAAAWVADQQRQPPWIGDLEAAEIMGDAALRQAREAGMLTGPPDRLKFTDTPGMRFSWTTEGERDAARARQRRRRAHLAGDHTGCRPQHCPDAPTSGR